MLRRIQNQFNGFTLIEVLVAMVVLAIGLLGMAGMTILVMRGNLKASDLTAATNICQLKMEDLKDQSWDSLGNWQDGDTAALQFRFGATNAELNQEVELNAQGKTEAKVSEEMTLAGYSGSSLTDQVKKQGPYKYKRTFVICRGDEYTDGDGDGVYDVPVSGSSAASEVTLVQGDHPAKYDCGVDPEADETTRVSKLACETGDIIDHLGPNSKEKKIKILCTWTDKNGMCHSVALDTTAVDQ